MLVTVMFHRRATVLFSKLHEATKNLTFFYLQRVITGLTF